MNCIFHTAVKAAVVVAFTVFAFTDAAARPVTREQARQQAAQLMQQRGDARQLKAAARAYPQQSGSSRLNAPGNAGEAAQPYYVFDRGQQEGFIIVAGDDELNETILGYCDSGSFDYDQMPPNMREWLDGYAKEIEAFWEDEANGANRAYGANETNRTNGINGAAANAPHRVPTHPAVQPLLTCTWKASPPARPSTGIT